jgi:septum formation protein
LIYAGKSVTKSVSTKVKFKPLDKEEILYYVENGSPMDKAGAYGIQEKGSLFVEKIDGDYFNVVGLPVYEIFKTLKEEFSLQFKDLI